MRVRLLRLLVCNRVGGGGHIDFFLFCIFGVLSSRQTPIVCCMYYGHKLWLVW